MGNRKSKFEELVEQLYCGSSSTATANDWIEFLSHGLPIEEIMAAMTPELIWENYDALIKRGAKIDIDKLIDSIDPSYILYHWKEFVARGFDTDTLTERSSLVLESIDGVKTLLERNANVAIVFELIRGDLLESMENTSADCVNELFSLLHKYGLTTADVKRWIAEHSSEYLIDDIVNYPESWAPLGINGSEYVEQWLEYNAEEYFKTSRLSDLPRLVSVQQIVDSLDMRDILGFIYPNSLRDFLQGDFEDAEGDIDAFAQKFIDEIGYSHEFDDFDAMLDLIVAGATVIDIEKFIDAIDTDLLDEYIKRSYYDDLRGAGISSYYLDKLL